MELLIPGLILVALMVYASTKIKNRAAAAFEPEHIETEEFSLDKPDGFLHVIGSEHHAFEAYSKEFGGKDNSGDRRATIEVDIISGVSLAAVCESITDTADKIDNANGVCEISTDETANESALKVVYKIVAGENSVYRLRFAVLAEHSDEYQRKIDETLDSFRVKMP